MTPTVPLSPGVKRALMVLEQAMREVHDRDDIDKADITTALGMVIASFFGHHTTAPTTVLDRWIAIVKQEAEWHFRGHCERVH